MSEFIFMLTRNDRTVEDALAVLETVKHSGLQHVGFKDIGASPTTQRELADIAHAAGLTVYLEVVSVDKAEELRSVEAGAEAGVDWVLGGTHAREAAAALHGTGIRLAPFVGTIIGHPSELRGTIPAIASQAVELTSIDGVEGIDLLAYRHRSVDPIELTRLVAASSTGRLIAAGSVVAHDQIRALSAAGAWGFTIGTSIFDGVLPGERDVLSQVQTALRFAADS